MLMAKLKKIPKKTYEKELERLQMELVKLQEWIVNQQLKVVVIFEGRDAAGKGGVIKRITEPLNPRVCKVVALAKPTEKERTQWYFQRYVAHLPSAGEMVLFDRSWYNRAGVERVMGFCSDEEYWEFLKSVPDFEAQLQRAGIILIKYWFSVSDDEQEARFQARINDVSKRWKLSDMDLDARSKWVEYSKAKDMMFQHTDTADSTWHVIESDMKRNARINCITHLLAQIPYKAIKHKKLKLPERQKNNGYERPPLDSMSYVPDVASKLAK
jgi:polyphosphate kinase 2